MCNVSILKLLYFISRVSYISQSLLQHYLYTLKISFEESLKHLENYKYNLYVKHTLPAPMRQAHRRSFADYFLMELIGMRLYNQVLNDR